MKKTILFFIFLTCPVAMVCSEPPGVSSLSNIVYSSTNGLQQSEQQSAQQKEDEGQAYIKVNKGEVTTVSVTLKDAALSDVLQALSMQGGINFVIGANVKDKFLNLYFENVALKDAIDAILSAHKLKADLIKENIFVIKEEGAPDIDTVTKVFKLKFASVSKVAARSGKNLSVKYGGEENSVGGVTMLTPPTGGGSSSSESSSGASVGIKEVITKILTGYGSLIVDERTNSIIVTDIASNMQLIEKVVDELDQPLTQVMIEAQILEISRDFLERLGLEYGTSTGTIAEYTGPSRNTYFPLDKGLLKNSVLTSTLTVGILDLDSLQIVLKAMGTDQKVRYLATPKILTISNETAEIQISTDAAVSLSSVTISQTGDVITQVEREKIGTTLKVTPQVNSDDYITMVIEPEVTTVKQSLISTTTYDPFTRAAKATVVVKDGETIMLGGLLTKEKTISERKVPVLGDIPLLNLLFKRNTDELEDFELIVLITPRIVHMPAIQGSIHAELASESGRTKNELRASNEGYQAEKRRATKEAENLTSNKIAVIAMEDELVKYQKLQQKQLDLQAKQEAQKKETKKEKAPVVNQGYIFKKD